MRRITILVDLDHTIFASWPRDALIGGCGGWDAYHAASVNDDVIHDVVSLLNDLHTMGWLIVGLTARPEKWRSLSMRKLVHHNVKMDELLMRPEEAYHPAPEMKIQLVKERFGENFKDEIAFLIEDRDDVCEAFHALGITTLQVKGRQND